MKKNDKRGVSLIVAGAALMLSALSLFCYNRWDDRRSGEAADGVLGELLTASVEDIRETEPGSEPEPESGLSPGEAPDPSPKVKVGGFSYVGRISFPRLRLELPVMADWSYKKLKVAPCRQFGSAMTDDFVIAGHNYKRHFGRLKNLSVGDKVVFTDMEGTVNTYKVARIATLGPKEVGAVRCSGHALVLYTCTYGGKTRVTVFCDRA